MKGFLLLFNIVVSKQSNQSNKNKIHFVLIYWCGVRDAFMYCFYKLSGSQT